MGEIIKSQFSESLTQQKNKKNKSKMNEVLRFKLSRISKVSEMWSFNYLEKLPLALNMKQILSFGNPNLKKLITSSNSICYFNLPLVLFTFSLDMSILIII